MSVSLSIGVFVVVSISCGQSEVEPSAAVRVEATSDDRASSTGSAPPKRIPGASRMASGLSGISNIVGSGEDNSHNAAAKACDANPADADGVLALASRHYREGEFAKASACARLATDLVPQAVEAQHLHAAALSALGRHAEAQVAFSMALLLDPDDPETLADIADFYINILTPKRRQTVMLGLEYARRGGQGALARRRSDNSLRGRLLLLEAEALSDLNRPDVALPRVSEAILLSPELNGATLEYALVLFRLLRFDESESALLNVLSEFPGSARAHHHLGLIYERKGRESDAEAHFLRARRLNPKEFFPPISLNEEEFAAEVQRAIADLPAPLRSLLKKTKLQTIALPKRDDLEASSPPFSPTILGLFRGLPLGVESSEPTARVVLLYRKNIARAASTRAELNRQIRKTLRHEIGHLEGYDEDELRRLGLE
ncbi:MAG: metallopeptidase family protein [Kofleriaceae bacterium]|nr:metallopeptidase family protein [Kofleriaceae bacterium]